MPGGAKKGHLVSESTRKKLRIIALDMSEETKKKISETLKGNIPWNVGIPCTEEHKKEISKAHLGKKLSEEHKAKIGEAGKGRKYPNRKRRGPHSEATKQKMSKAKKGKPGTNLGKHFSEEHKQNLSKALKGKPSSMLGKCHSEETKEKMKRSAIKRCRENMVYWERLHKALQLKPNKPERALDRILQKLLPGEYKYVGDLSFILGGKNPDFMNINGRKKLIEMYGSYWHKDDDPQERIDLFKQYGFDTLIVWEDELKDNESLNVKLEEFHY